MTAAPKSTANAAAPIATAAATRPMKALKTMVYAAQKSAQSSLPDSYRAMDRDAAPALSAACI